VQQCTGQIEHSNGIGGFNRDFSCGNISLTRSNNGGQSTVVVCGQLDGKCDQRMSTADSMSGGYIHERVELVQCSKHCDRVQRAMSRQTMLACECTHEHILAN